MEKIYRGMENGAEAIQKNFEDVVSKTTEEKQAIKSAMDFEKAPTVNGKSLEKYVSELLNKEKRIHVPIGYGLGAFLHRKGNVVSFDCIHVNTGYRSDGWNSIVETIPKGFRPAEERTINAVISDSGGGMDLSRGLAYSIRDDGGMYSQAKGLNAGEIRMHDTWITTDDFPE